MTGVAPEEAQAPSAVADHDHRAPEGEPWGRCVVVVEVAADDALGVFVRTGREGDLALARCGLAAAAHVGMEQAYRPRAPYRCADCIAAGRRHEDDLGRRVDCPHADEPQVGAATEGVPA